MCRLFVQCPQCQHGFLVEGIESTQLFPDSRSLFHLSQSRQGLGVELDKSLVLPIGGQQHFCIWQHLVPLTHVGQDAGTQQAGCLIVIAQSQTLRQVGNGLEGSIQSVVGFGGQEKHTGVVGHLVQQGAAGGTLIGPEFQMTLRLGQQQFHVGRCLRRGGQLFQSGQCFVILLHPQIDFSQETNGFQIVTKVQGGKQAFLCIGQLADLHGTDTVVAQCLELDCFRRLGLAEQRGE